MVWCAISATPGANYGLQGFVQWFKPAADDAGPKTISIPDDLKVVNMASCWVTDGINSYNCGGFTQNAVLTKDLQLWASGIRAPHIEPNAALSAGPGITANVICYLRFFDARTGQRSPLSAPSATLAAANQTITYDDLDLLEPPERATHIEAWESRDGSLPRFVFRRQIGVVTVTHAKALGDLGEAETSDWEKAPRCRYATFWHERLVMAGNDADPTAIYFMGIGEPEHYEGLFLRTKSKQPVVGIAEINGRLLVFCPFAWEVVSGWDENDLRIDIMQPHIGALSHHGVVQVDGWLFVPTHEQVYMTDGASVNPVGLGVKTDWAEDCAANRRVFQKMWAEHHPDEHVIKFYVEQAPRAVGAEVAGYFAYYTLDYETCVPLEGGGYGQPRWVFDTQPWEPSCYALLAVPGGRRRAPYVGAASPGSEANGGRVLTPSAADEHTGFVDGNDAEIVSPALHYQSLGGDNLHAMTLEELALFLRCENTAFALKLYSGDIECYYPPEGAEGTEAPEPAYELEVAASAVEGPPRLEPKWTWVFKPPSVSGRAFIVRIVVDAPSQDFIFGGLQTLVKPGPYDRRPGRLDSGGEG